MWEMVFHHAHLRLPDKDDSSVFTAEGKVGRQLFRIVYGVDDDTNILNAAVRNSNFQRKDAKTQRRKGKAGF